MDPARLNFSGKPLGGPNPYLSKSDAEKETIATVEVVPAEERRLSSVELDKVDPDEIPLLTTFLLCFPLDMGVRIIALFDLLTTIAWAALVFVRSDVWWFFFIYTVLGAMRLYYFCRLEQKDGFHVRRNLYYSNLASSLTFVVVFILAFFTIWVETKMFPVWFLLWQIGGAIAVLYFLLVIRQHFVNYASELKNILAWDCQNLTTDLHNKKNLMNESP